MANFSMSAFISATPRPLFEAYLKKRGLTLPGPLPTDEKPIVYAREVISLIRCAEEKTSGAIETDLDRCSVMSDHAGETALYDVADALPELRFLLEAMNDQRARALHMLIHHWDLFREAEFRRHSVRYNTPRFSSRFRIEFDGRPLPDIEAIEGDGAFRDALQRAHPERRAVDVEAFRAITRPAELMVAVQTANAMRGFSVYADGQFGIQPIRSASMSTVLFDAETGIIDVAGKYWRSMGREGIANAFVEHVLKLEPALTPIGPTVFNLMPLVSDGKLTVEPGDVVREARVMEVRYLSRSDPSVEQTWHSRLGHSIIDVIAKDYGAAEAERMKAKEPEFVRIRFYASQDVSDQPIANFDLSLHREGMANLSTITRPQKMLAEKYLARWGVREEVEARLVD